MCTGRRTRLKPKIVWIGKIIWKKKKKKFNKAKCKILAPEGIIRVMQENG